MASPVRYFDLVREMNDAHNHRLRLVAYARQGKTPNRAPLEHELMRHAMQLLRHGSSGGAQCTKLNKEIGVNSFSVRRTRFGIRPTRLNTSAELQTPPGKP